MKRSLPSQGTECQNPLQQKRAQTENSWFKQIWREKKTTQKAT